MGFCLISVRLQARALETLWAIRELAAMSYRPPTIPNFCCTHKYFQIVIGSLYLK